MFIYGGLHKMTCKNERIENFRENISSKDILSEMFAWMSESTHTHCTHAIIIIAAMQKVIVDFTSTSTSNDNICQLSNSNVQQIQSHAFVRGCCWFSKFQVKYFEVGAAMQMSFLMQSQTNRNNINSQF